MLAPVLGILVAAVAFYAEPPAAAFDLFRPVVGGGRPARVQLWVVVGWRLGILPLLGVGGTGRLPLMTHAETRLPLAVSG